jgi:phenylalanyl-tRNA synthetase beta chain
LNAFILDVDNKGLTNRPDLTGHFGVARELNAMYFPHGNINYSKLPDYQKQFATTNIFDLLEHTEKKGKKQIIAETQGLNNYILLEINNIEVKKSDFFMRLQTLDLGSSPINNWVDFSNLFMNISGHPVHFFDAEKVEGNIIVRNAKEGEEFTDLFGKTHQLLPQDIVIADEKKALCLGGVMGGLNSGITEETKNILIEIANFDPVRLRKTGVRLGLRTDSELRNEKNINPTYSLYCLLLLLDELNYYKKGL